MTRELINTIKAHGWTKSELVEIMEFCAESIEKGDCIIDEGR